MDNEHNEEASFDAVPDVDIGAIEADYDDEQGEDGERCVGDREFFLSGRRQRLSKNIISLYYAHRISNGMVTNMVVQWVRNPHHCFDRRRCRSNYLFL